MADPNDDRRSGPSRPPYRGEAARGGEILLTTRRRRFWFVGGLFAVILFVAIATIPAPL